MRLWPMMRRKKDSGRWDCYSLSFCCSAVAFWHFSFLVSFGYWYLTAWNWLFGLLLLHGSEGDLIEDGREGEKEKEGTLVGVIWIGKSRKEGEKRGRRVGG